MERTYKKYKGRVQFLGLFTGDTRPDVLEFIKEHKITFPTALDEGNVVANRYELVGHPMAFYISADGEILETRIGGIGEKLMEKDFKKLFF
ncbi:MAG: TlpA family protein disulfide reductase [Actinomycetia bacterium]|nr:TlpA family protein disulfide reductase [Actinomycetes bacterium]